VKPDSRGNLEFSVSEGLYKENKGSVIWNGSASGVNLDKFDISKKNEFREIIRKKYNIPSDAFVFGFVGRVTCDKGINELLSSYKMLLEEDERVRLLIVGRTEIDDRIDMALLEWAQNEKRIDFCGYTNEVEKYISAMDCYVLPSYREGFGLGVVEAEAMGVPVVVTDIPGPRDAIINEKTGLAVPKKDTEQLYKAMRYMLCNRQESEMMGHEGYKFASENFEQKKLFQMIADDRTALLMKTSKSNKDKK
jgi:glycosyltransferase involved in cell wall biosynthesis